MPICVIAQPIHPIGAQRLREAGVEVVQSPGQDVEALRSVIATADAVIVRDALPADVMDAAPRLRVIANHGTGTDKIAVDHAVRLRIPVVYTPDANVRAVAEHALTLMLAAAHRLVQADAATRAGQWRFRFDVPMWSLYGKTLGIIGLGRTGRLLCGMVRQALAMDVVVWSPSAAPGEAEALGARSATSLQALLAEADVISLHRPLRPDTRHTLDAAAFAGMKPGAIVINTSRGGLIDETALTDALASGRIVAAGLDVFEQEPLPAGLPIGAAPQAILTPHVAGSSQEALHETARQCADQVVAVLRGERPAHLLHPALWADRRLPQT